MNTNPNQELTFQLSLEDRPADAPALYAYLISSDGDATDAQPINEKGIFRFKPEARAAGTARVVIAPQLLERGKRPTLAELRELSAYEPTLKLDPKSKVHQIAPVPQALWPRWPICRTRARGRVEKEFCLWLKDPFCFPPYSGFCPPRPYCFSLPVCPARVHICIVRPRIIWTLPDAEILRIRADLLNPILVEPPFPPDPIGPIADELDVNPHTVREGLEHAGGHGPTATPPQPNGGGTRLMNGHAAPDMLPERIGEAEAAAAILSSAFRFKLHSTSTDILRRAIADHVDELKPLIPYFDWCRYLYTCTEIRVVDVDEHGHFDTTFFHECGDRPDLYFWVEYLYNTQWVTVYRPSLCSGTYWNYVSGTEVVLKTTDSRVTGCRPITGRFLEITRVGTNGWLPLVDSTTGLVSGLDFGDDTIDASGVTIGSGTYSRPFGGTLVLHGNFGFNLPDAALATHYRVSYKPSALPDVEANWTLINTPLQRAYNDTINLGGGASKLVTSAFELKDPAYPDLYRIPKENAQQQTEIPSGADLLDRRWASDEFAIAVLDSEARTLAEGTYDLRIQLCRAPTPGAAPVPVQVPREVFQMPDPTNFHQSAFCDDAHLIQATPGGPTANAFRMRLKVDRDACVSAIADAVVDGSTSDPQCGILHRGTTATLAFTASHPQGRATFGFGVVRGNGNDVGANTGGFVTAPTAQHGYVRSGSQWSANIAVSQLFASTACPSAAFAQTLNVLAMATNGSTRLSAYDAPERHAAFAIISP